MDTQELKHKMMKLWSDIFHDTESYISIVFDNYFDPDYIEYHEENGKIVSALLGVPYQFSNGTAKFKGLYLCGLATLEGYRHRGIMSQLINQINQKAARKGYTISFLIPSSDILRLYYSSKEYYNAMFVVEDRYTNIHSFEKDYHSILLKEDNRIKVLKKNYYDSLTVEKIELSNQTEIDKVVDYISKSEESTSNYTILLHSPKDIIAAIRENIISGGEVLVCRTVENKITGVAFIIIDDRKRIIVPKIYHYDNCSYFRLLDKAKNIYSEFPMSVICYPEETERRALWSKVYRDSNPDGGSLSGSYGVAERVYDVNRHTKPYGMMRILNYREILKFIAMSRKDCKFSILIKNAERPDYALKCTAKDGEASFEEIHNDLINLMPDQSSITVLNKNYFSDIILRKKDSNSLIMDALGIPRLAINMSLLLD